MEEEKKSEEAQKAPAGGKVILPEKDISALKHAVNFVKDCAYSGSPATGTPRLSRREYDDLQSATTIAKHRVIGEIRHWDEKAFYMILISELLNHELVEKVPSNPEMFKDFAEFFNSAMGISVTTLVDGGGKPYLASVSSQRWSQPIREEPSLGERPAPTEAAAKAARDSDAAKAKRMADEKAVFMAKIAAAQREWLSAGLPKDEIKTRAISFALSYKKMSGCEFDPIISSDMFIDELKGD
jgi:hypothetical protein